MEVTTEVRKQYRSGDAWAGQLGNVVRSLLWAGGTWMGLSVLIGRYSVHRCNPFRRLGAGKRG